MLTFLVNNRRMNSTFDTVIKNGNLFLGEKDCDIGIKNGKIVALQSGLKVDGNPTVIEAKNKIIIPGFVDSHMHIDKAFIPPGDCDGLMAAIEESTSYFNSIPENELFEDIVRRGSQVIERCIAHGTTAIKTHVMVHEDLPHLKANSLDAVIALREKYRDYIDVYTIVPIWPYEDDKLLNYLHAAAEKGDLNFVGGYPRLGLVYCNSPVTDEEFVNLIFDFAKKHNLNLDLHVDESDEPNIDCFNYVLKKTCQEGWQGRVTASHVTALSAIGLADSVAHEAILAAKAADINIITLSSCNLYLMSSKRRGVTRVCEFMKEGVNIAFASDNVRDPFRPFGNANMLEEALITAQVNKLASEKQLEEVMRMGTYNAAKNCNLKNYGLKIGADADLVVLDSESAHDAIISQSKVLYSFKRGRLVSKDGNLVM